MIVGYSLQMNDLDSRVLERLLALADEIAHAVDASPLTKSEVARRAGMTRQHVTNVTNKKRQLTLDVALRLGLVLGLDVRFVSSAALDALDARSQEGAIVARLRELSARRRAYVLDQIEIARHLPDEALPRVSGEVGAIRSVFQDDDRDLP